LKKKYKVGPGQKFPWVKAGKNPIRHNITHTLNMDKVMIISNETLLFLGNSALKSIIGIFVILTKKSKIAIFRPRFWHQHKKLPYQNFIFKYKYGLIRRKFANFRP